MRRLIIFLSFVVGVPVLSAIVLVWLTPSHNTVATNTSPSSIDLYPSERLFMSFLPDEEIAVNVFPALGAYTTDRQVVIWCYGQNQTYRGKMVIWSDELVHLKAVTIHPEYFSAERTQFQDKAGSTWKLLWGPPPTNDDPLIGELWAWEKGDSNYARVQFQETLERDPIKERRWKCVSAFQPGPPEPEEE